MEKFSKLTCTCALMLCMVFLISSCESKDATLAKALEGRWIHETEAEYDDEGDVFYTEWELRFNYSKGFENGGMFRDYDRLHYTIEDDESITTWTSTWFVSGFWKIIGGNLYMKYNLSSIKVSLDDYDFQWKDGTPVTQAELEKLKGNVEEMMCSESNYEGYYEFCQRQNEGGCYTDLEIKGNTMSFAGEYDQWIFQKTQK